MKYDFSTKDGLLAKLISYADNPDDDNIRYKQKIKQALIHCPELLYLIHDKELEVELFDEDGNLNVDEDGEPIGDWGAYFGSNSHIRDYLFFPDVQTDSSVYLCYQVSQRERPRYNAIEKYALITFNVFVYHKDNTDDETGLARHDMIASIIREKINWSNIFGIHCELSSDIEGSTDNNYVHRTLVFEQTTLNSLVKTSNGKTSVINNVVRQ